MSWISIQDPLITHALTSHFVAAHNEATWDLYCDWRNFTLVTSLQNSSNQKVHHCPSINHWRMPALVRNGKYTESNITTDTRHRASSHHPWQGTEQHTQKLFQENRRNGWSVNKNIHMHDITMFCEFYTTIMWNVAMHSIVERINVFWDMMSCRMVSAYQPTWHHNPENWNVYQHYCDNLCNFVVREP